MNDVPSRKKPRQVSSVTTKATIWSLKNPENRMPRDRKKAPMRRVPRYPPRIMPGSGVPREKSMAGTVKVAARVTT